MTELACPLCLRQQTVYFYTDKRRDYWQCVHCDLVFVPAPFHLPVDGEKAEYDKHQNSPDDPAYRQFLSRLFDPMLEIIPNQARGLDFGCGPGPALAAMFAEAGLNITTYDKFYQPDSAVLNQTYQFITATEVFEHLAEPGQVIAQLFALLEEQGCLGIMTKLVMDKEAFAAWHYKNDPTHICFFSESTLRYIAKQYDCELNVVAKDAFIFCKTLINTKN